MQILIDVRQAKTQVLRRDIQTVLHATATSEKYALGEHMVFAFIFGTLQTKREHKIEKKTCWTNNPVVYLRCIMPI